MAIVALPVAATGCLSPTDITLEITSDLACSKLEGIAITAGPHGTVEKQPPDAVATKCADRDGGGSFGTLVLTPAGSSTSEITVRVVAGVSPTKTGSCKEDDGYAGCLVVRRVLHYDEHTPLTLPIELDRACLGVRCLGEDATCVDGVCLPSKIDDPSRCINDACSQDKLFAGQTSKGCLGDLDFTGLGTLPGTRVASFGTLSSDGRVVFGFSANHSIEALATFNEAQAFRCASFSEQSPVVVSPGHALVPSGSNASGTVMVGTEYPGGSSIKSWPVRWTGGVVTEFLPQDSASQVNGCDRDTCTVLVGESVSAASVWRSRSHLPISLRGEGGGILGGAAVGVDSGGKFVFGTFTSVASIWDLATGASHELASVDEHSIVNAATPNGSRVVGATSIDKTLFRHAALWKAKADEAWTKYELQTLDAVPGPNEQCQITSISDDGAILAGLCFTTSESSVAVIWDERTGFAPTLVSERVDAPKGWTLMTANVSGDGTIVAGGAKDSHQLLEPYIARLK